jgi:hypothetical protein
MIVMPGSLNHSGESPMDPKKKAIPLPTKFLVVTQIVGNGEGAKFTFSPVGADDEPIALPVGTPAVAYEATYPALHLTVDPSDLSGLTVLGRPLTPGVELDGITVHGQTTLLDTDTPIEGVSDPVNILYGPIGPMGYKLAIPETDEQKSAREKAKSEAKAAADKDAAARKAVKAPK